MSRTITLTDDQYRVLCGLVCSEIDTDLVYTADRDGFEHLRAIFPPEGYTDLPPDEDGEKNDGIGTAIKAAPDYEGLY